MYLLKKMSELPDIASLFEEKEGKGHQRQRMFNAMRNQNPKEGQTDKKAEEVMLSDFDEWAISLLDYPRSDRILNGDDEFESRGNNIEILCVWSSCRLYLFLDATIYLGSIAIKEEILSVDLVSLDGDLLVCTGNKDSSNNISVQTISTNLCQQSSRFLTMLHLQSLSSNAFHLLTYCYDSLIHIRNLYRTTHNNCITPWIRKGKSIEVKYSTHFQTEMQILLLTNFANEIITTVLIGNETMTEGDLKKLEAELASAWSRLEGLFEACFLAFQKVAIIFEEVKGCCLWPDRYRTFLPENQESTIEEVLDQLSHCQQQSLTALRQVRQEANCWTQFYKWFKVERARQEAIRDQVGESRPESTYNVLLIAEFLKRGFVNYPLESLIGVVLDKKARGTYVDNDEEEEEEINGQENSSLLEQVAETEASLQGKLKSPVLQEDLESLLQDLKSIPDVSERKAGQSPSAADLTCLLSAPFILTGPSKGLQDKKHHSTKGKKPSNLLHDVKSIITTSCNLFSQAFHSFVPKDLAVSLVQEVSLSQPLASLRSDALTSIATASGPVSGTPPNKKDGALLRSYFDQARQILWLLGINQERGSLVLANVSSSFRNTTNTIFPTLLHCPGQIIDVGFYSDSEVVALLKDEGVTRIFSFSLDLLKSTSLSQEVVHPIRCYEISNKEAGSDATQLSLNHVKDVAATLDDHGSLIYWDFVLLERLQDEDQDMS